MMRLSEIETAMQAGALGKGAEWAIAYQKRVGEFFEAEDFAEIRFSHMITDAETLGASGLAFLEEMAEMPAEDRRLRTLAIVDSRGFDDRAFERLLPGKPLVGDTQRAIDALGRMGAMKAHGYFNNHSIPLPAFGESCAFSGTPTVVYANTMVGVRCNFEAGPSAIAAMLTGRVPRYGFHLDANRRGTDYFKLEGSPRNTADWGAVGAIIGRQLASYWKVPVIDGIAERPDAISLNHLALCLASYGSHAMFHVVGVTPEARDAQDAFGGPPPEPAIVTQADIDAFHREYDGDGEPLDVVALGAPQLTMPEVYAAAETLAGRKVHENTTLLLYTPLEIKEACQRAGIAQQIEGAGGLLVHGPDFFATFAKEIRAAHGWTRLMTQSVKTANITEGYGYQPVAASLADCIESAVAGRIVRTA